MKEIQIKIPGKLYVAGEYAVVEKGHSAIITAVDRFIYLTICETKNPYGKIFSKDYTEKPARWIRNRNRFWLSKQNYRLKYIRSAIHMTERYLYEQGVPLKLFDLNIHSELKNSANKKLGLGSSAAITVGTIRALLQFYGRKDSNRLVYKLAVLAQMNLKMKSSFGDLAASTYTGWIKYTNFDHPFVLKRFKKMPTKDLVEMKWPALEIKQLNVSKELNFLVGWTGRPASTNRLVGNVQKQKNGNSLKYDEFLKQSEASVKLLAASLSKKDVQGIKKAIKSNRQALLAMGNQTKVLIETPQLKKLIDLAKKHDAVAKTSGAGGGDSGIAFVFNDQKVKALIQDWKKAAISLLPL
ncbi:MAG: phosphomevalonate kinase, partial [Tetragenococcus halophilus]|nr:phosphomevalonate kinase [Tetragenococcus halophilus]